MDPLGDAAPGERLQLVLQFGGASGYGLMSIEQRRQARDEMGAVGKFDGNYYHYPDGRTHSGLNAIWEHVFGDQLRYSHARYKTVPIAVPSRSNWLPLRGAPGVEHKFMGSFTERGVWVEMIKRTCGSTWSFVDPTAVRLFVVLAGAGHVGGDEVRHLSALKADPAEDLDIVADEELELYLIGLLPVELPATESEQYVLEELPSDDERSRVSARC